MTTKATVQIDEDVMDVLKRSTVEGNVLNLPPERLDPKFYNRVAKVLLCLGGKWNRGAGAHIFDGEAKGRLEAAMGAGEVVDKKKLYQFYPTPRNIAELLIDAADIENHHLVLEPSAGDGAIVNWMAMNGMVHVCEIQEQFQKQLPLVYPVKLVGTDFLQYNPGRIYDRIVANPPFTKAQDAQHVGHMLDLIKPGGRIVSVMASSITFRDDANYAAIRRRLDCECSDWNLRDLPAASFAKSGTNVNTVMLIANRA